MKVGDTVVIDKCDDFPTIVGRTVKVKGLCQDTQQVELSYGRGRPPNGRPSFLSIDDVSTVPTKE